MGARFATGHGEVSPPGVADRHPQTLSIDGRQPMSEAIVRVLTEDDWYVYRALWLAGLQESPAAFVGSYAEEVAYSEERWRSRMGHASRLLAERDGVPGGIVSGAVVDDDPASADVFGLWVDPATRRLVWRGI